MKINDPIYLNKINGIRVFCIVTYIIKLDAFFYSFACVRDQYINVWIALLCYTKIEDVEPYSNFLFTEFSFEIYYNVNAEAK